MAAETNSPSKDKRRLICIAQTNLKTRYVKHLLFEAVTVHVLVQEAEDAVDFLFQHPPVENHRSQWHVPICISLRVCTAAIYRGPVTILLHPSYVASSSSTLLTQRLWISWIFGINASDTQTVARVKNSNRQKVFAGVSKGAETAYRHMNIWVMSELDLRSSSASALQSFLQDFPLQRVGNLCYSCTGHQKIFSLQSTPFYSYKYPTALPQLLPCCS